MATRIYSINKGINRPVEFKGLKAQYILYLGVGLFLLLVLFAILYLVGISPALCLLVVFLLGTALFGLIYHLSNRYGQHGLMKRAARKRIPKVIKCRTREWFC
ncbi:DUF4133 domain-containing protein [Paraflavisolibacter sp. H34]|uniref:DUF4133 domain-containing protein n=1 Tax=Huijunlia imazamoxiresistens TaxID=3127457 RepID=UPI003016A672